MAEYDPTAHDFPSRTLCSVLENMRSCLKTLNLSPMSGLIEEAQLLGDRMESGLDRQRTIKEWLDYKAVLKKEIKALTKERDKLKKKK